MNGSSALALLFGLGVAVTLPESAFAYETKSEVGAPCHEELTLDALARVRSEHGLAPWLEPHGEDRALVDDLPISNQTDLAGATLVLANRDVDLDGNAPDDLDALAPLHGAPESQKKHCLRAPPDDEPDGSLTALSACRAFITDQVQKSLAGLGPDGAVDAERRTSFEPVLDFRGSVEAELPTFYVEMGRALHSVQDAFSHQWRTDDHRRVTTVLNYSEVVNDDFDESQDGPPHSAKLDQCEDLDSFRAARLATAEDASVELVVAALAPAASDAERMARVDAALDAYTELHPGCTPDNDWCDAPENAYRDPEGCVCAVGHRRTPPLGMGLAVAAAALLLARRRRRRRLAAFAALALAAPEALAERESDRKPEDAEAACVRGGTPVDTSPEPAEDDERFPFGVSVALGVSVTRPAAAIALGGRYRISERFLVGVDAELNPWLSRTTKEFRAGTTNLYATGVLRFPMAYERINLRSTLELGVSRMNFDLYGVPKGTVGPYVGFNALGIDLELGRSLYLVVNPAHIAIPIPQTSGVPFSYPQYRLTVGLQYGA